MSTTLPKSGSGIWSCYSKQDPETRLFISHCLDLNVKVSGKNPEQAWDRLKTTLKAFYEYSYSCDPDALNITASADEWEEYKTSLAKALRTNPDSITVETIELVLHPPK